MQNVLLVLALFIVACSETPTPPPVTENDAGTDVGSDVDTGEDVGDVGEDVSDVGQDVGEDMDVGEEPDDCDRAAIAGENAGCVFFAADLDRLDQDGSASAPWGLVVANAGDTPSELTVTRRTSAVGEPLTTDVTYEETLPAGGTAIITLPQAEVDCSETPGDQAAPGTCLSAHGFRLDATTPVTAWQLNALQTSPHSEAALLLPLHALGEHYRVVTFSPSHPVRLMIPDTIVTTSNITIVGTAPDTTVTIAPTWRLRGNPPIEATQAGESLTVTLGPFEVLHLASDDATLSDPFETMGDLSGSTVQADKPIAVFASAESANTSLASIPTYPGWDNESCCPNHLAEQLLPDSVLGQAYVVGRSPIRSTSAFREADVVRFVGGPATSTITTTLPAPFASFTLAPGEVRTTYTQGPFTAEGSTPFVVALYTVAAGYVDGPSVGGPSMTFAPAVSHFTREATFALPPAWGRTFIVVVAPADAAPLLDGVALSGCSVTDIGMFQSTSWQQHACEVDPGIHTLRGDAPFGLTLHGRNSTNAFSTPGALRLVAP